MRKHLSTETYDGSRERKAFCSFGLSEIALPLIASSLVEAGVGASTAGSIAAVAAPALTQAGIGAGIGALTGNPGGGAALGALSGGMSGLSSLGGLGALLGGGGSGGINPVTITPQVTGGTPGGGPGYLSALQQTNAYNQSLMSGAPGVPGAPAATNPLGALASKIAGGGQGGGSGLNGTLAILAALAQNSNRPSTTAPSGSTANMPWNPTGYLNRTPNTSYTPSSGSYYTYGQQPEPQFFNGNELHFSHGGTVSRLIMKDKMAKGGYFSTGGGENYVEGEGDGQSDDVPAKLSRHEFVFDAGTVSRLGNGDSDSGADKLEQMRRLIAQDAGSKKVVQNKTRSPLEYLRDVA